ncbi:hypothetical protein QJS04_geneDACA002254 [Acorus gramineus]|uniref:Uncharacterized protein n=1 Tax=Acorus gramineus TaxID=55184 RepID=A0AAV9A7X1_ACOGR|nr:hypothetical protein QJS04_geneDACA002254 [Acorus gramineus]
MEMVTVGSLFGVGFSWWGEQESLGSTRGLFSFFFGIKDGQLVEDANSVITCIYYTRVI